MHPKRFFELIQNFKVNNDEILRFIPLFKIPEYDKFYDHRTSVLFVENKFFKIFYTETEILDIFEVEKREIKKVYFFKKY